MAPGANKSKATVVFRSDREEVMMICQGCGVELSGRERFCRKCGAPVPTRVEDLVDTYRFDPFNPVVADATQSRPSTNPLQAQDPGSYPLARPAGNPRMKSMVKEPGHHRLAWLLVFLLLVLLITGGVVIGTRVIRSSQSQGTATVRRSYQEIVQSSLGFTPGRISDSEFPTVRGVFIDTLTSDDGPAALAKIQAGDVLMELNGQIVRNSTELGQTLNTLKPGDEVDAKIHRDGQSVATRIKIADPSLVPPAAAPAEQGFLGVDRLNRRQIRADDRVWGVEIRGIGSNVPADLAGLQSGDIILEFNGHRVRTVNELRRRIYAAKPRSKVVVRFYRGDTEHTVDLIVGHR